jgi:hypothetical protein
MAVRELVHWLLNDNSFHLKFGLKSVGESWRSYFIGFGFGSKYLLCKKTLLFNEDQINDMIAS